MARNHQLNSDAVYWNLHKSLCSYIKFRAKMQKKVQKQAASFFKTGKCKKVKNTNVPALTDGALIIGEGCWKMFCANGFVGSRDIEGAGCVLLAVAALGTGSKSDSKSSLGFDTGCCCDSAAGLSVIFANGFKAWFASPLVLPIACFFLCSWNSTAPDTSRRKMEIEAALNTHHCILPVLLTRHQKTFH